MLKEFLEKFFILRSQGRYDVVVRGGTRWYDVGGDAVHDDLTSTNRINKTSALWNLQGFDTTKQLPHDIIHTLLEEVFKYV